MSGHNGSRLPDFIIVGAMRGGTTSLSRYLDAHPQAFLAPQKEVHFFDLHHERGVGWYASQFDGARAEQRAGESTPMYSYSAAAARRMGEALPNAKLIYLLRDPVARAYSHYCHNVQRRRDPLDFVEALRAEASRSREADGHKFAYVGRSRYGEHLHGLLQWYPRENLHLVMFEDLVSSPVETYRAVCRFLEIDDEVVPEVVGRRTNAPLRIRSVWLRDRARALPAPMRKVVGRLNTTEVENPPLGPDAAALIRDGVAADVAALARDFDVDIGRWGF